MAALALRIAHDVLRSLEGEPHPWTDNDIRLARAAISGIRAQQGVFSEDTEFLGYTDGWHATAQLDVWVYG